MAPVVSLNHLERLIHEYRKSYRQHVRGRDLKLYLRRCAIPFDYLPSIAGHSGSFLPLNPEASRSFEEFAEALAQEIVPLGIWSLSHDPQEAQEDLEDYRDLLRICRQELSSSRNRSYSALEEQIINCLVNVLEKLVAMAVENNVYLAKLAEQAERYEGKIITPPYFPCPRVLICCVIEMVECMKNVASADQELSVEERNLLSVAYKNVIGARRASWRIVTSIEQKEESKGNESQVGLIKEYRQKIEAELAKICEDILEVLDEHLIKSAQSGESKVFYHKMYVQPLIRIRTKPAITS